MHNWLTASRLDRVDEHRCRAEWIAHQWVREDATVLEVDVHGNFATDDDGTALALLRPFGDFDPQEHFLLGTVEDAPVFVTRTIPEGPSFPMRAIAHSLDETDLELAMAANSLLNWHRDEPRCARCGAVGEVVRGGHARRCTGCGVESFPRCDPAVIVAVLDQQDRMFLGHHRDWDPGRMSLLAGFVEAGESFEQAVHRELAEEADLSLGRIAYLGSQPWPFPRSLMIGYAAEALSSNFSCDDREIVFADWYSRERLTNEVDAGTVRLPGGASIAAYIIDQWMSGALSCPGSFR